MLMRTSLLLLLFGLSVSACARAPQQAQAPIVAKTPIAPAEAKPATATDAKVIAAVKSLDPRLVVEKVEAAPLPGFRMAVVGGQTLYVSDDGRYMLQGTLYDVPSKRNLSGQAMASFRQQLLSTIPESERIRFAPANPKYTVQVFTDVECGYCRKLHSDIAEYNKLGIAVEYLAFPRMGPASEDFRKMVSVWCAKDRKQALTLAKDSGRVTPATCNNTVAMQYDIGQRVGLQGTPMILASDGYEIAGYLPPAQLLQALQRWEQRKR